MSSLLWYLAGLFTVPALVALAYAFYFCRYFGIVPDRRRNSPKK